MKVKIRSIENWDAWVRPELTAVEIDGKLIGGGTYGGETEDNSRYRHYAWVEDLIEKLAEALGAEVEIVEEEVDEDAFEDLWEALCG